MRYVHIMGLFKIIFLRIKRENGELDRICKSLAGEVNISK